jgi:hypothetical protein
VLPRLLAPLHAAVFSLVLLHPELQITTSFFYQAKHSTIFACFPAITRFNFNSKHNHSLVTPFFKGLAALGRLVASVPAHSQNLRACDQASLHAAICLALQVEKSESSELGGCHVLCISVFACCTFHSRSCLQSDINSLHDPASLSDPSSLSTLDALIQVTLACRCKRYIFVFSCAVAVFK